jgi:hypothetical protein
MSPKYVLSVSAGIASCFQQIPLVGHTALGLPNGGLKSWEFGMILACTTYKLVPPIHVM